MCEGEFDLLAGFSHHIEPVVNCFSTFFLHQPWLRKEVAISQILPLNKYETNV